METIASQPSKALVWTGRVLSALVVAVLLFSGVAKVAMTPDEETKQQLQKIGWDDPAKLPRLAALEIACAVIYAFPPTSVLGAILVTGYMGGATATHARVGDDFILQIAVGVVAWLGIFLREPRLWKILPWRW